jgi:hypothetical protein
MLRSNSKVCADVLRIALTTAALVAAGSGCGGEVEVLTGDAGGKAGRGGSDGGAGTGGAGTGGTTGGAGTGGMTGGAGPTAGGSDGAAGTAGAAPVEGKSVCYAIDPSDLTSLQTGEPCRDLDVCEPDACAGMVGGTGVGVFAACRNHQVQLIQMTLLDVPANTPVTALDNGVSWDDCEAAIDGGVTGEACTWAGESCIRPTEDTCCRAGAQCVQSPGPTTTEGLLHRIQVCAPDCENLEADTTQPVVTDCASAAAVDSCHVTPACEGDFTCYRTAGDWVLTDYEETSQLNGAMWCAGGALVGGYGLSWGP